MHKAHYIVCRLLEEEEPDAKDWLLAQNLEKVPAYHTNVVHLQGDEAVEPLRILAEHGRKAAIDYLKQWDYGEGGDSSSSPLWGTADSVYWQDEGPMDRYVLSWNRALGTIGLTFVKLKWEDDPDE